MYYYVHGYKISSLSSGVPGQGGHRFLLVELRHFFRPLQRYLGIDPGVTWDTSQHHRPFCKGRTSLGYAKWQVSFLSDSGRRQHACEAVRPQPATHEVEP